MLRLLPFLALMPLAAAADWSPHPALFNYDATFAQCAADPAAPDLARSCADNLAAAYVVKRAVARAAYLCGADPLDTCAAPFEEEGLPAIAMRIARDVGCDARDVLALPADRPLPPDHCITIAADIMIDEGVVPLFTDIACAGECLPLARLHADFWRDQVTTAAPDDATVADLQNRNATDCAKITTTGPTDEYDCLATRASTLWADITLNERNN